MADGRWTLTHQVWVSFDLTLVLQDAVGRATQVKQALRGRAGEPLAAAIPIGPSDHPMVVGLVLRPRPDLAKQILTLSLSAEVRPAGQRQTNSERSLVLTPERAGLVELWRDTESRATLAAALVGRWEEIPSVTQIAPGAEPIDLVVELLAKDSKGEHLIEQHRLGGVVGSPVSYDLAPRQMTDQDDRLSVEVVPSRLHGSKLTIGARVLRAGVSNPVARMEEQDLLPGYSIDLPLQLDEEHQLVVRVTPYF